jgi:hypothetical protein
MHIPVMTPKTRSQVLPNTISPVYLLGHDPGEFDSSINNLDE